MTPEELEQLLAKKQQAAAPTPSGIIPTPVEPYVNPEVEAAQQAANANAQAAGSIPMAPPQTVEQEAVDSVPAEAPIGQQYAEQALQSINSMPIGGGGGGPRQVQTATNERNLINYTPEQSAAMTQAAADKAGAEAVVESQIAKKGAEAAHYKAQAAEQMEKASQMAAQMEDERRIARERLEGELESFDRKIQDKTAELTELGKDPWSNKSTGQRVMAGIAIFLGGAVQGLKGGSNIALDIINRNIDREMDALKGQIGTYQKARGDKTTAFGDFSSELAAKKQQLWQDTINKVSAASTRLEGEEAQANAQMLVSQLQAQAQADKMLHIQNMADKTTIKTVQTQKSGGGGGGLSPEKKLDLQAKALKNAKMMKDLYQGDAGDELKQLNIESKKRELGLSDGPNKATREKQEVVNQLEGVLDRMVAFRKEHGATVMPGDVKARGEVLSKIGSRLIAKAIEKGVLTEEDAAAYRQAIGDIGAISPSRLYGPDPVLASLDEMRNLLRTSAGMDNKAQAAGLVDRLRSKK